MFTKTKQKLMEDFKNIRVIDYNGYLKIVYRLFLLKAIAMDLEKNKDRAMAYADMLIDFAFRVGKERFAKTEEEIRQDVLESDFFKLIESKC